MLKLIMIEVKQGFVWVTQGTKYWDGGCKKGVTLTTPEEMIGYRDFERIHVFPCILGREIRDSENKNGHA